jgi:hypothetical protein
MARRTVAPDLAFRAIRRILKPLVKFMIAQGITYPSLLQLLKSTFIDVAKKQFPLEDRGLTASRVSMLTGIHRAEVKRLLEAVGAEPDAAPRNVSLGAQLVARWISEKNYLDKNGNPLPLARHMSDGGALSFEALAASVSRDIRARSVLDEWLRLGVCTIDAQNRVHLVTKAFVPQRGFEEKAFYFANNLHDHIAVSVDNMLEEGPARLERSVYYSRLTPASVETLTKLSFDLGARAVQDINRLAVELDRLDGKRPDATQRINFGVYFYAGPNTDMVNGETSSETKAKN